MVESSVVERDELVSRSQLFMVRVWREELGNDETEWRGKIQRVATGEVKYFRDWETLTAELEEMLPGLHSRAIDR